MKTTEQRHPVTVFSIRHRFRILTNIATAIALFPCSILADAAVSTPAFANSGSAFLSTLRLLGALALVLGVFFGGLWLWRNWQRLLIKHGPAPKLTVLEGKSLGQRHMIYVVGYKEQRLLLAASPAGVAMLTALPNEDSPVPAIETEVKSAQAPAFGALLFRAIAQRQ